MNKSKICKDEHATQLQLPLTNDGLSECEQLRIENRRLLEENALLKRQVENLTANSSDKNDISTTRTAKVEPQSESAQVVVPRSDVQLPLTTAAGRVKLFQSLFHGRDDVYADRWKKKDGSANYSPAKLHNWEKHTRSERGKWQCAPSCQLLPLTAQVIEEHLRGQRTVGIYPLLTDETCWLLAVDFDECDWKQDAVAFLETCDQNGVPAYLERSRSGAGAHVWIFFEEPMRASLARSLGTFLLSETKRNRYQLGFNSYDRMFPNQDTMPRGGFGNLIALPLQAEPRKQGNSVFVDRNLEPIEDQWTYLASIIRMRVTALESIVRDATARDVVVTVPLAADDPDSEEPWKAKHTSKVRSSKFPGAYPKEIAVVLSNMVYVPKNGFDSASLTRILELGAFQNPEFYQKQATRQSTHDTPRVICCAENLDKHIALPRGCLESLDTLLAENGIEITATDEREQGQSIGATFKGQLRPEQIEAAKNILSSDIGILCASTAFGKTVVASYLIAQRKTNTLILVHSLALVDQWRERLTQFLDIPPKSIGQIGGGKKKRTGIVDIATIQSLGRKGVVADLVAEYGHIVVDECHHISAFSFEQVIKKAKARYVLGLTATPVRKDGHQPIIMMQCGPVRYKDSLRNRKLISGVKHVVVPRQTGFQMAPSADGVTHFQELYDSLAVNADRNDMIFDDILKELEQGRSPLVITERIEHLDGLASRLQGFAKNIIVLKGGMSKKERTAIFAKLKAIPNDAERLILASGKYIGEGFDDSRLDTLFLLLPISFEGRVEQYAGRLHREHEGKTDVRIYDYVDSSHPMLKKMFERRCVKYRKLGYEIREGSQI